MTNVVKIEVGVQPKVNNVTLTTLCSSGGTVPKTTFGTTVSPSSSVSYQWEVVDNADKINLSPTFGTEEIPQFTAKANTTNAPIVVTFQVTPQIGTCVGTVKPFTLTINPAPVVNNITNVTACSGDAVSKSFGTTITGATITYDWTVTTGDYAAIGLAASGSGNISSFNANTNTGTTAKTATVRVTPKIGNCSGTAKESTITVNPVPLINNIDNVTACSGGNVPTTTFGTTITPSTLVDYSWEVVDNADKINLSPTSGDGSIPSFTVKANNTTAPIEVKFKVTPKIAPSCSGQAKEFTLTVYAELTPGTIDYDGPEICPGDTPTKLRSLSPAIGGDGDFTYLWEYSADNGVTWTGTGATNPLEYAPGALTKITLYRRKVKDHTCNTVVALASPPVTVPVRQLSQQDYPDLRIRVCPDGTPVYLSKYLDTCGLINPPEWASLSGVAITSAGEIAGNALNANSSTLTYKARRFCLNDVTRKVYVEVLKNGRMRSLRDSISICYENAEAVNINHIFGIDASGEWTYFAINPDDGSTINIEAYVTKSVAPSPYASAIVLDGKTLHSIAKQAVFTYTPAPGNCLDGKSYTVKIVLTEN
jgi:hypothetical protein